MGTLLVVTEETIRQTYKLGFSIPVPNFRIDPRLHQRRIVRGGGVAGCYKNEDESGWVSDMVMPAGGSGSKWTSLKEAWDHRNFLVELRRLNTTPARYYLTRHGVVCSTLVETYEEALAMYCEQLLCGED